ncbi:MAG: hypothetical protein BGO10_02780 [Chlamydia sp. 32-24]|nr:MAG: hypothetical protein BGO10_02780 [Chlamydia sp. 32-24]
MSTELKKKLCWNCEGRVALTEENCPFCGVYLSPSSLPEGADPSHHLMPPYKMAENDIENTTDQNDLLQEIANHSNQDNEIEDQTQNEAMLDPALISLATLITGTIFFLFGLVIYVFSINDIFTLSWNKSYWLIFLLISLPLFMIGIKNLKKVED